MAGLSTAMSTTGATVGGALAFSMALKGVAAATDYLQEKSDKNKFAGVIDYAKRSHPELKKVPHNKLVAQMNSFYTLAPQAAVDKELGSSMLATTNDYGGTVDLATAKLVSDINGRSSGRGSTEEILGFVNAGSSMTKLDQKRQEIINKKRP